MENNAVHTKRDDISGDNPRQEQERRLLAHSLLSSGRPASRGSSTGAPRIGEEQLEEEVKAAMAMRDFFRRNDLSSPVQSKEPETAVHVVQAQVIPQRQEQEVKSYEAVQRVETEQAPEPAPASTRPQGDPVLGDANTVIERAGAVKEEVAAYSHRVRKELDEARSTMLEAERRYKGLESETKESANRLAKTIREALQQIESLAG